jgi:uncharacterized membrane protein
MDLRTGRNIHWKIYAHIGFAILLVSCFIVKRFDFLDTWQDYVVAGGIRVVSFDMGYNLIALKSKDLFYEGHSSYLDNRFGRPKWSIYFGILLITILVKIFL